MERRVGRFYVAFRMRREVEIVNKLGLHARPAAEFVRYVTRFKSTITICKGEENFSAASILEVLSANLNCVVPRRGPLEDFHLALHGKAQARSGIVCPSAAHKYRTTETTWH